MENTNNTPPAPPAKKRNTDKPFKCMECGKRLSLKAAQKATYGVNGCPGCGGGDIDLA